MQLFILTQNLVCGTLSTVPAMSVFYLQHLKFYDFDWTKLQSDGFFFHRLHPEGFGDKKRVQGGVKLGKFG